ncbi:hypothetical protein PENSPDRAFT_684347 [Peniophora sp. CONT]|nr:hypothetical protein PENSPDRAFT_684347 [Peniophora sp. CONT]
MSALLANSASISRPLPPWTNDVNSPNAPKPSSEGETTGAGAGRLEADQNVLDLFLSNHIEALRRWRNLYRQRARCGTNRELWAFTAAGAHVAQGALQQCRLQRPGPHLRVFSRLLEELDLCPLVQEIVCQDDFFDEYPDFIMSVLEIIMGVLEIIMSIVDISAKATSLLGPLQGIIPALCDTAWENRDFLCNDENVDRYYPRCRHGVRDGLYFVILSLVLASPERYEADVAIRRAGLLCWFYCPDAETDDNLTLSAVLLQHATRDFAADFYDGSPVLDPGVPSAGLVDFMRLDVLPALGAAPYLERLLKTLQHPSLLNNSLIWTVSSACRSIANHPELLTNLAPSGVLSAIIEAINAQALRGNPDTQSQVLAEIVGLYSMTIRISASVPGIQSVIPAFVREGCLVEMEARALRICVAEGQVGGLSYEHSLYALDGFRTCAIAMNKLSPKNTLRKTIRQGFREQWYPTLAFLRRTRTGSTSIGEHDQVTLAWQTLGEELGLDENTQKADYEREIRKALRRCAWKGCQYHEREPPVALRACKGCADARYCSSTCQRKDWRDGHKSRCKRLNDATPA